MLACTWHRPAQVHRWRSNMIKVIFPNKSLLTSQAVACSEPFVVTIALPGCTKRIKLANLPQDQELGSLKIKPCEVGMASEWNRAISSFARSSKWRDALLLCLGGSQYRILRLDVLRAFVGEPVLVGFETETKRKLPMRVPLPDLEAYPYQNFIIFLKT